MLEPQPEPEPEAEVGGSAAATIEAQQRTIAALEAQLQHWEGRSEELRKQNCDWRDHVHPSVAAVLPPDYHPDVHRALLQASGAKAQVVDKILKGFSAHGSWRQHRFLRPPH